MVSPSKCEKLFSYTWARGDPDQALHQYPLLSPPSSLPPPSHAPFLALHSSVVASASISNLVFLWVSLTPPGLPPSRAPQAETTALEPVDFADVELAPLNKNNLRRLMHEDVLAYRPELRSPAAGSSLPEPAVRTGGREAARDGGVRGSSSSGVAPPPPPNGAGGTNGTVASGESHRMANGGSAKMHAGGAGAQRERSSRSDPRDGRSSGATGRSAAAGSSSGRAAVDARTHAAVRVRSGGAVARHPFPTEG